MEMTILASRSCSKCWALRNSYTNKTDDSTKMKKKYNNKFKAPGTSTVASLLWQSNELSSLAISTKLDEKDESTKTITNIKT